MKWATPWAFALILVLAAVVVWYFFWVRNRKGQYAV